MSAPDAELKTASPTAIYRIVMAAAGEFAPQLRRCLWLLVLTAALQGLAFALFVPLFRALLAGGAAEAAMRRARATVCGGGWACNCGAFRCKSCTAAVRAKRGRCWRERWTTW